MNSKKFGGMLFALGIVFGLVAAYQLSIPYLERWEEFKAIAESAKYDQPTSEYLRFQVRFADARQMGLWFGIAAGVVGFLGLAFVFSASPQSSTSDESQPINDGTNNSADVRKCPFCAETVKSEAKVCRYCQRDLPPVEVPTGEPVKSQIPIDEVLMARYKIVKESDQFVVTTYEGFFSTERKHHYPSLAEAIKTQFGIDILKV